MTIENWLIFAGITIFCVFIYGLVELIVFPNYGFRWLFFSFLILWIPILTYRIGKE